jgi:hypothetical protein
MRFAMPYLIRLLALFSVLLPLGPVYATDYNAVNEDIWPSQNDIAQTAGNGKKLLENQWQEVMLATYANNIIYSGCALPASSGNLNISVPACQVLIKGRFVDIPGSTTITATASQTNHVFLKLTRDGANLVTGAAFEVNLTGTAPADSTKIGTLVASGSAITSTTDARLFGPHNVQSLVSGSSWVVPAGLTRIYVEVFGASGGGGGGGEGQATSAVSGGAGTAGGTTTFDILSVTGGAAGGSGRAPGANAVGIPGAAPGVGTGGLINMTGGGRPGGIGGGGGVNSSVSDSPGLPGGTGGEGGYAASYFIVTPGASITTAIGAAGAAGAGGTGTAGIDGGAGTAGQSGLIVVHY